jgi:pSer/pThr/pTyr-binding forkhead associated (FHA) protein
MTPEPRTGTAPRLIVLRGDAVQRHVALDERAVRIGRGDTNDLVLDDPGKAVSRVHA